VRRDPLVVRGTPEVSERQEALVRRGPPESPEIRVRVVQPERLELRAKRGRGASLVLRGLPDRPDLQAPRAQPVRWAEPELRATRDPLAVPE